MPNTGMEVKTGTGQLIKTPQTPHERPRLINRYYEPTSAQFLTVDPAYALTLSVYGYVNNDPLNFTDPSRAFALTLLGGPIGAVVGTTIGTVSYLANHGSHGFSARGLAGAAVGGFVGRWNRRSLRRKYRRTRGLWRAWSRRRGVYG